VGLKKSRLGLKAERVVSVLRFAETAEPPSR